MNTLTKLKDKSLLFLEDNSEFANNTIALLSVFVRVVHHARTVAEAEECLASKHVDLILSDIKLKNENGLDFIQGVRNTDREIPVIVLSGHKDEAFLFRSIPLKLTAYLLKPIKYEELIDALGSCSEAMDLHNSSRVELKNGWYFHVQKKTLEKEGETQSLNKKEAALMEMLSVNKERLMGKEMFQHYVWENEEMSDSALTNFLLRIRRRFGKDFIYTIPDLGYRFTL